MSNLRLLCGARPPPPRSDQLRPRHLQFFRSFPDGRSLVDYFNLTHPNQPMSGAEIVQLGSGAGFGFPVMGGLLPCRQYRPSGAGAPAACATASSPERNQRCYAPRQIRYQPLQTPRMEAASTLPPVSSPLPRGPRMVLATHPRVHAEGRWCPPRIFIEASATPFHVREEPIPGLYYLLRLLMGDRHFSLAATPIPSS